MNTSTVPPSSLGNSPAYIFTGVRTDVLAHVLGQIESLGVSVSGNPDVLVQVFHTFGIDDAHDLAQFSSRKNIREGRRFLVISAGLYTREAQNALLKTLEEPPADSTFVLIADSASMFLPTIHSRAVMAKPVLVIQGDRAELGRKFLSESLVGRFAILAPILELREIDDGESKGLAKEQTVQFVDSLLFVGAERIPYGEFSSTQLSELILVRKALASRSPVLKQILELLAVTLPCISS